MLITKWDVTGLSALAIRAYEDHCGSVGHESELTQFSCLPEDVSGFIGSTTVCPHGCSAGTCNR